MIDQQKMIRLIDHRMSSLTILRFALNLRRGWEEAPPISIHVEGHMVIEGNLNAVTNPMIEAGILHCRSLIEFLGLCADGMKLAQIRKRRATDVGVEFFHSSRGPLQKLDPTVALSRYGGGNDEAEKAFLKVLFVANKGLAHNTIEVLDDADGMILIDVAISGVQSLMTSYFYTPLGLRPPDLDLKSRPR